MGQTHRQTKDKTMIIGIAGKSRAGKTTAADYIEKQYGIKQYALADPLKSAAIELFGITREMAYGLNGYDREQIVTYWGISVREMLQKLGTECMRMHFGANFWTKRAEIQINKNTHLVISDIRFDNESLWVTDKGGIVININRSLSDIDSTHMSEEGINEYDHDVENFGDVRNMYHQIDKILTRYCL